MKELNLKSAVRSQVFTPSRGLSLEAHNVLADAECPRVMVMVCHPPEFAAGSINVRGKLHNYPADRLLWYTMLRCGRHDSWWRPEVQRRMTRFPLWRGIRFAPSRWLWRASRYHKLQALATARHALQCAKDFGAEVCWLQLDYNAVFIADEFIRSSPIPVHVYVHDDPSLAVHLVGYPLSAEEVDFRFAACMRRAQSRACISTRMAQLYRERWGLDSLVTYPGINLTDPPSARPVPDLAHCPLRIVSAGYITCPEQQFRDLLDGLRLWSRQTGYAFEFHVSAMSKLPMRAKEIKSHGWMSEADFSALMSTMHIGYSCDAFTDIGRRFAASSFPSKLLTYMARGFPFLYQGPSDSTVGDLVQQYQAGIIAPSQEPTAVADGVRNILAHYTTMGLEGQRAVSDLFDNCKLACDLRHTLMHCCKRETVHE